LDELAAVQTIPSASTLERIQSEVVSGFQTNTQSHITKTSNMDLNTTDGEILKLEPAMPFFQLKHETAI
jgi:hypothetical protein